jgi:hypothetical protein
MTQQKIGHLVDQMQTTLDGIVERLTRLELALANLKPLRKPSVYVDETTALLSSEEADIRFIARKVAENELSKMQQENGCARDSKV